MCDSKITDLIIQIILLPSNIGQMADYSQRCTCKTCAQITDIFAATKPMTLESCLSRAMEPSNPTRLPSGYKPSFMPYGMNAECGVCVAHHTVTEAIDRRFAEATATKNAWIKRSLDAMSEFRDNLSRMYALIRKCRMTLCGSPTHATITASHKQRDIAEAKIKINAKRLAEAEAHHAVVCENVKVLMAPVLAERVAHDAIDLHALHCIAAPPTVREALAMVHPTLHWPPTDPALLARVERHVVQHVMSRWTGMFSYEKKTKLFGTPCIATVMIKRDLPVDMLRLIGRFLDVGSAPVATVATVATVTCSAGAGRA